MFKISWINRICIGKICCFIRTPSAHSGRGCFYILTNAAFCGTLTVCGGKEMANFYSFLDKWKNQNISDKYGCHWYDDSKTHECGGVEWENITTDGDWIWFAREKDRAGKTNDLGFKIHLSVDESDLENALGIVSKTVKEHDIFGFKMAILPFDKHSGQQGKDFAVFFGKGENTPERISSFLNVLERRFLEANVKSGLVGGNLQLGDKPVQGSQYAFYRYEKVGKRYQFRAPETGDMMDAIVVDPLPLGWYNPRRWRTISDYPVIDYIDSLNAIDYDMLDYFFERNGIHAVREQIQHGDGSVSNAIIVESDASHFWAALNRETYHAKKQMAAVAGNDWKSIDSWRKLDGCYLIDNIDKMDPQKRDELYQFLQRNHMEGRYSPVEHTDKSVSAVLTVIETPEVFAKKLRQLSGGAAQQPYRGR